MILLYTSEKSGAVFIKTDQLDGETDWKLRKAISKTQQEGAISLANVYNLNGYVRAEPPHRDIYNFQGTFYYSMGEEEEVNSVGLDLENTLWASTVLTMGQALALVVYTGGDTKSQLNMRDPRTKTGKIDEEISFMSFLLFMILIGLSALLLTFNGYYDNWYITLMRFILLLSYIIPISLRVNLDLAKAWYSYVISSDKKIPETIPRNTTIPEELGRVQVLFSDKTGTLTQNEMEFKALYADSSRYNVKENGAELNDIVKKTCEEGNGPLAEYVGGNRRPGKALRRKEESVVRNLWDVIILDTRFNLHPCFVS